MSPRRQFLNDQYGEFLLRYIEKSNYLAGAQTTQTFSSGFGFEIRPRPATAFCYLWTGPEMRHFVALGVSEHFH